MRKKEPVWMIIIYGVAFLTACFLSHKFVELKPVETKDPVINVYPAQPVVIHDTVKVETVRWRTPVKKVCCCEMLLYHEKEKTQSERIQEAGMEEESR